MLLFVLFLYLGVREEAMYEDVEGLEGLEGLGGGKSGYNSE